MVRITNFGTLTGGIALLIAACAADPLAEQDPIIPVFTATVDGVFWQADQDRYDVGCEYDTVTSTLRVWGSRQNSTRDTIRSISLQGSPITGVGTVTLGDPLLCLPPTACYVASLRDVVGWGTTVRQYWTTEELLGAVTITEFDLALRRCSGTFSFVAAARAPFTPDTVVVTEGFWTAELTVPPALP